MFIKIPNVLSKNDFDWTCWDNWSMGFHLTIGNLSVCSSQVNFISCVNLGVLWQGKLTDDDSSVDLHEIIHWTTLNNLQAMLKKENLRKNFLRVKQIADQNLGRCGLCILYTYIQYCLVFTCYRYHIALNRTHLLKCMYVHGNFNVVAKPVTLIIIHYSEIIKYGCTVDWTISMICRNLDMK